VRASLRRLADQVSQTTISVSPTTVRRLLKKQKIGLVSNRKNLCGPSHPDRDRQFRYIKRVKKLFQKSGRPVISIDAKNKELIGPFGIYDLLHNQGSVYVSASHNTSELAVEAIRAWWNHHERPRFAQEDALLILCDAGGSNNCRFWLWKHELQLLANELGIAILVCHYPTGNSKYNPIEYRLFSQITINWAGKPLHSLQTMLNYIQSTTTSTGLTVKAFLLDKEFKKGRKLTDEERQSINLKRRSICPTWNYVISPDSFSEHINRQLIS